MGAAFLITTREGLEMALIVAIVLAYLRKLGREQEFGSVWAGVAAAAALAVVAGVAIFVMLGSLEGRAEEVVEGVTALTAAGVLTWMVFWMRRQARTIKGQLETRVDEALLSGSRLALAGIAFFAVLREGLETALFLLAATVGTSSSAAQALGAVLGLAVAAGIGYGIYSGSRRVNLRSFFKVTGILILLFAAGLLAKGIHEFQEEALLGSLNEQLWDLSWIRWLNPEASFVADLLKGLFGWHPAPSVETVVAYLAYAIPVAFVFLAGTRGLPAVARVPSSAA